MNRQILEMELAIMALDEWYKTHESVGTAFGEQPTNAGYVLTNIAFMHKGDMRISVYNKGRVCSPDAEDSTIRNGDEVVFFFDRMQNKIMTDEERERICSEEEHWLTKCQDRVEEILPPGKEYLEDAVYDTIRASFKNYGYVETYNRMEGLAKELKELKGAGNE